MNASLDAPRLQLEPLDPRHADALFEIYADPAVSNGLLNRAGSRREFQLVFDRAFGFRDTHGMWAVLRKEDGALIGRVGFFAYGEQRRPELAFLLSQSAWGRGLATEACRRAIRFALEQQPWSEIVAVVRPSNRAAFRVLDKLGFALECAVSVHGHDAQLLRASRRSLEARVAGP